MSSDKTFRVECLHENFAANVSTHRLNEVEGGPIVSYLVEVELHCAECGLPFRFIVPRVGVLPSDAGTNANGQMLNVYAEPSDGSLAPSVRLGYQITAENRMNPGAN